MEEIVLFSVSYLHVLFERQVRHGQLSFQVLSQDVEAEEDELLLRHGQTAQLIVLRKIAGSISFTTQ